MMKRLVSLLLAAALLCCAVPALGETYDEMTYAEPSYEGGWYGFYDAFYMYVPTAWVPAAVSDEDYEAGVRFMAGTEHGEQLFFLVYFPAEALEGAADAAAMAEILAANGVESRLASVNGVPCVFYADDIHIAYMQFFTEQGDALAFAFYPEDDEEMQRLIPEVEATLMLDLSALGDVEIVNLDKGLTLSLSDAFMTILRYFHIIESPDKK